jgi:hypothetical protein
VADRLRGRLFAKEPERGLGEFEYARHGRNITLWTIPGTSDHVGFLKLQNENKPFVLELGGEKRLSIVVTNVKPSGDRFEIVARSAAAR